jgi:hypothetical protein
MEHRMRRLFVVGTGLLVCAAIARADEHPFLVTS